MKLFAVYVDDTTGKALPVVISALSARGPTVSAKYVRDATEVDVNLPDYCGFDFGDSTGRFFTGNPDLLKEGRDFLNHQGRHITNTKGYYRPISDSFGEVRL